MTPPGGHGYATRGPGREDLAAGEAGGVAGEFAGKAGSAGSGGRRLLAHGGRLRAADRQLRRRRGRGRRRRGRGCGGSRGGGCRRGCRRSRWRRGGCRGRPGHGWGRRRRAGHGGSRIRQLRARGKCSVQHWNGRDCKWRAAKRRRAPLRAARWGRGRARARRLPAGHGRGSTACAVVEHGNASRPRAAARLSPHGPPLQAILVASAHGRPRSAAGRLKLTVSCPASGQVALSHPSPRSSRPPDPAALPGRNRRLQAVCGASARRLACGYMPIRVCKSRSRCERASGRARATQDLPPGCHRGTLLAGKGSHAATITVGIGC